MPSGSVTPAGPFLPGTWTFDHSTSALVIDSSASDAAIPLRIKAGSGATVGYDIKFDPAVPGITIRGLDAYGTVRLTDDFSADAVTVSAAGVSITDGTVSTTVSSRGVDTLGAGPVGIYANDGNFTRLAMLTPKGVVIGVNTIPADGDVNAGEAVLWFDDTNGAAKLMVKAKQANGTVRTGSVNLA
jgi:hypothetical protein